MTDYSQPFLPNVASNAQGAIQLQSLINSQQDRAQQQQTLADIASAGKLAANEDYEGAQKQLFAQGHWDQALKMRELSRQMNSDELDDVNKTYGIMGRMMMATGGDPAKIQQTIQAMKAAKMDTSQIERMQPQDAYSWILARSNLMQQALENEQKNRAMQRAEYAGSATYAIPGADGQPTQTVQRLPTGEWTQPQAVPAGVDLANPLGTKPAAGKQSSANDAAAAIKAEYARNNPGAPPLPDSAAISAATAITSKYNAGLSVKGWNKDENGNPTTPIYAAPEGTAAALRANQWNNDAVFARSRAQKSGGLQANNDQRATAVVPVLNHLSMVDQALDEPNADSALGAIHGNETFQKWRGSMFPSDVETPAEFGKIRQGLESAQAEVERVYTSGQGVITDSERNALKGIIAQIKDVPNAAAAKKLVENARQLIGGIMETPTIQDVQANPQLASARAAGLAKVTKFLGEGGQSIPRVTSEEDYNRIPSGSPYIDPNGVKRRKQ